MCLYDVCVVHSECHPVGSYCGSLTNGQNRWPINDARCVQCHVSLRSLMDVYEWTKGMRHRHALHSPWQLLFPSNFLWYFSFLFFFYYFSLQFVTFFLFQNSDPESYSKALIVVSSIHNFEKDEASKYCVFPRNEVIPFVIRFYCDHFIIWFYVEQSNERPR